MSILYINTGTSPNAGNGDVLRTAFWKVNQNFAYLSTLTSSGASTATITVSTINSASQYANTVTNVTGLRFDEDSGFDVQDLGSGNVKVLMNSTFKYWNVNGSPGLVAEGLDTVNFITGNGIDIITNTSGTNKSITFAVTATFGFTGSQGDIGYVGSQGAGFTGSQGSGFTGSQGDIGYAGSQGTGFTGSQGDIGFVGSQGDIGYAGSQGAGFTGSQGDVGYVGSQGDIGYVGSIGIGFTGSQGDQGPIGPSGGPVGPQGDLGYVGSQGDLGYVGSQGDIGYVGSQGDLGFTGSQGDIGYIGSQGDLGYIGSQGDIGYTGSQGDIGYTGSIGYVGSQGGQGPSGGPIGFTGSRGVQGPIGITGFVGSLGDIGFVGSLGFNGSIGFIGSRGVQGPIGNIGPIGPQGNQGPIGNVGPSGGPVGFTGSEGAVGPSGGPIGPAGFTGSQGIQGPIGFAGSVGYIGSVGPGFDISTITNQLLFTNSNVTFYVVTGTHLIVAEEFEANFGSPGSAGYAFVDLGYDTGLFSPSDDVVDILARSGTVVRFQGSVEPEGFVAYVVPYGSVIPHATLTHQLGSADRIWTQFYVNTASLQKLYIGSNIAITTQTNDLKLAVSNNTWTFSNTGTIVFPDGTKQTTAYTGTVATGTVDFTNISSHVLPSADLTYDLGSTSSQWRSLYVGTGTIYIGGVPITVSTSGTLIVNGTSVTGGGNTGDRLTSSTYNVILEGTTGTLSVPNVIIAQGYELGLAGSQGSYEISRYLRVRDGDVFSHLHLDTPDNSSYDIILGNDSKFVKVDHTGTVVIGTNEGIQNLWTFGTDGTLTFPDATVQTTAYKSTSGSWTLATGSNTVSITVPLNGNYQMWVNGNVPNGIVEWNATVNVSNPNVPAIGSQYAWYYTAGNALVLTAIPDQIVGTVGVISTSSSYVGNTANVFTFGITNNSTSSQVIYWGYTTL